MLRRLARQVLHRPRASTPLYHKQRLATSATDGSNVDDDRDLEALFLSENVQRILRQLTQLNVDRVYESYPQKLLRGWKRPDEVIESPVELLTDEELSEIQEKHRKRADVRLQMPPVMRKRSPCERIIVEEPELDRHNHYRIVFTDISFGVRPNKRHIFVREIDGTLRTANWDERDRMQQTFLPKRGRHIDVPKIFDVDNMNAVLQRGEYEMLLNRTCLQFEPDDERYIDVCHRIYDEIDELGQYEKLRSTRHFGPLLFYLGWNRRIERFLVHALDRSEVDDAVNVVALVYSLNANPPNELPIESFRSQVDFIDAYIKSASNSPQLRLALHGLIERHSSESASVDDNQVKSSV